MPKLSKPAKEVLTFLIVMYFINTFVSFKLPYNLRPFNNPVSTLLLFLIFVGYANYFSARYSHTWEKTDGEMDGVNEEGHSTSNSLLDKLNQSPEDTVYRKVANVITVTGLFICSYLLLGRGSDDGHDIILLFSIGLILTAVNLLARILSLREGGKTKVDSEKKSE